MCYCRHMLCKSQFRHLGEGWEHPLIWYSSQNDGGAVLHLTADCKGYIVIALTNSPSCACLQVALCRAAAA